MLALVILAALATSQNCMRDSIAHIVRRQDKMPGYGPEIVTLAGHDFFVLGQDAIDPAKWHEGEKLEVCPEPDVPQWVVRGYRITDLPRKQTLVVDERK